MSENDVFAAAPSVIARGGDFTKGNAVRLQQVAQEFFDATPITPENSPVGNDMYGKPFNKQFIPAHAQLTDTLRTLVDAVRTAGEMTTDAGRGFHNAQDDALANIPPVTGVG